MVGWRVAIEMLSRLLTTRCLGSGCERLGRVGGWERRRRESCGLLTRCEILILACNGINVQVRLLSLEHPELDGSRNAVSAEGKCKAQLKPDVASKWRFARMQSDGANEPDLGHASHHPYNAAAEGEDSCDARRETLGLIVVLRAVTLHATAEDEMLGQRDSFVDC